MDSNSTRVIIRAHLKDIPGVAQGRASSLGRAFCEQVLCRPLNSTIQTGGYDAVHVPAEVDTDKDVSRWFLFDFNVLGRVDKDELLCSPHQVYLATRQNGSWIFILRDSWVDKAKIYASQHPWGVEQSKVY